jgi:hypothetical protein
VIMLLVALKENVTDRIRLSTTARSTICPYNDVLLTQSKNQCKWSPSSLTHTLLLNPFVESDSSVIDSELERAKNGQLHTVKAIFSVLVACTVVTFANVISVGWKNCHIQLSQRM